MTAEAASTKRSRDQVVTVKKAIGGEALGVPNALDEVDLDLSSDIKGILAALEHVRHKAKSDGQKRNEEILNSVTAEIKSLVDGTKGKAEKERQNFIKASSKIYREVESAIQGEDAKYQEAYEKFCKDRTSHLQAYEDIFTNFADIKEKMLARYEQQRKKEKVALAELEKICAEKIADAERLVKKRKQEGTSFSMLRKSLGSFWENQSEDEDLEE